MRPLLKCVAVGVALLASAGVASALVRIDIDLGGQRMLVSSDSGGDYSWPISSGRPGHLTPNGRYRPMRLYPIVYSAKYNNAPMPHSIFFHGQYAIHGTTAVGSLGRPASHGCVRLAPENAAMLYSLVEREGAVISIVGSTPGRAYAAAGQAHRSSRMLAYAPRHRARSLREWARDPLRER